MQIYNSMTRKKEEFKPIHEGKVGIYACGPTVYNYFHIGNARPFIIFDVLRRYLEYRGYEVTFVQNFTDIDDKMIRKANEEGVTVKHDSLKILDCSCVLSLFCIVFKVRCSQASLYIIPRARFSVNTFFEVFLLFLHLFSKPLFFNGFRHLLLHFFLLTLSPFSYLSFPCLSFSSCSLSPFPFYSAHSVTPPRSALLALFLNEC